MDKMNIPSIILLALIVIALVLVIIYLVRNGGGCSGDCSACKSCNRCKKEQKGKSKLNTVKGRAAALPFILYFNCFRFS